VGGVPADITSIGIFYNNRFIVKTNQGYYSSDEEVQRWELSSPDLANWSKETSLPSNLNNLTNAELSR